MLRVRPTSDGRAASTESTEPIEKFLSTAVFSKTSSTVAFALEHNVSFNRRAASLAYSLYYIYYYIGLVR